MALLVVLFHLPEFSHNRGFPSFNDWPILNKGTEAVYAFFALSGFLIIRNLFLEKSNYGQISIKNFYRRRIFRIFPLYYAVLIFGTFYYKLILPNMGFQMLENKASVFEILALGGTFFSNILASLKPGGIIEILWSIGIEEQFYLMVAPLFLMFSRKNIVTVLIAFSLIYFVLFNFEIISFFKEFQMYFYYFSISGLFAIFTINFPETKIPKWFRLMIFGLVIVYFFSNLFKNNTSDWSYQLISTLLFPLFILSLISRPIAFFENKRLKYFGKISYGIYMLHAIAFQITGFFVLKFIPVKTINPNLFIAIYTIANLLLTLLMAHLSYQYFEKYFLKIGNKKED